MSDDNFIVKLLKNISFADKIKEFDVLKKNYQLAEMSL